MFQLYCQELDHNIDLGDGSREKLALPNDKVLQVNS